MPYVFHPTDLASNSDVAFRHALRLSMGGSLTVAHIHQIGQSAADLNEFPKVRMTLQRWGLREEMPSVRKIEMAALEVENGLYEALKRSRSDMIVVGYQPRSGLAAWLKPSVSASFVRRTSLTALFVPEGYKGFVDDNGLVDLSVVMVAISSEPDPQVGIDAATSLLRSLSATPDHFVALHAGKAMFTPPPALPKIIECHTRIVVRNSDPVDAIVETAKEEKARLIVMTTAGRDSIHDMLTGSITERVLRKASCPILAVPAPSYVGAEPR